jgi:uridine kinase
MRKDACMTTPRIERYADLAARLADRNDAVTFIAVDGGGGAGKTVFAEGLAKALGASIVHMDDFGSFEDFYDVDRLVGEAILPLEEGRAARYRSWDWWQRALRETSTVPANRFVIVEGISSGRTELSRYVAFLVWVECPPEIRLRRGLERDGREARPTWERWMRWEDEYATRERPKERADLIIDGAPTTPHDRDTEFIVLDASPEGS